MRTSPNTQGLKKEGKGLSTRELAPITMIKIAHFESHLWTDQNQGEGE